MTLNVNFGKLLVMIFDLIIFQNA